MLTTDEAFRKFKSRLELNSREQDNASKRHTEVRDHMRCKFSIDNDFLTGSYARHTKTKPLKDIDVFVVLGEKEKHYREEHPSNVMLAFETALVEKYGSSSVSKQRRAVTVDFGVKPDADDKTDYRVLSLDVVAAFKDGDNYEIPDATEGKWVKTNPKVHAERAVSAHQAYSSEWKGLVRMVKYWNNKKHADKPVKPSFLLEVMALECLHAPWSGNYAYEMQSFFATLSNRIDETWNDPANLGPPVSDMMDSVRRATAKAALKSAARECTLAIDLARQGKNYEALKAWRELFGPMFPLS
ncbi:MAG: nucleotidyltransferase [Armatimonadetes bacterium]|nr:nucleotidyltransferase [Armatimonadota bacterium]